MLDMVQTFFRTPNLSLRQIGQAIRRLGLVFASLRSNQRSFAFSAVVALIFRTIDGDVYHRFCRHEISDLEAIDSLLEKLGGAGPPLGPERSTFEETIIAGWCEMAHPHGLFGKAIDSPLYLRYKKQSEQAAETNAASSPAIRHALAVCGMVDKFFQPGGFGSPGFLHSVRRIELFSDGLLDEATPEGENS